MEPLIPEFSSAPDDPSAFEYAEWHGLVHKVMKGFKHEVSLATGKFESGPAFFRVMKAAVSRDCVFLRLRLWSPLAVPRSYELSVGGSRFGMYAMMLRPDGGFQVVGEKYVPMCDRILKEISTSLTPSEFDELQAFLREADDRR
jgi:hypothetical protein